MKSTPRGSLGLRVLGTACLVALATCGEDRTPTSPGPAIEPVPAPAPAPATQSVPAITHTLLTSGNNRTNQKVYTTASIAPAPNALVTVAVLGHRSGGANPSPVITGGGMSAWVEVATVTLDPLSSPLKRLTIFRAMSAAPGSGPLTIRFNSSVSNCQWIVSQWSGVDVSGTNGAGAIGQTSSSRADAGSGLTVTLAAFGNPNNVGLGVFAVASQVAAIAPGAGFTEIAEHASAESPGSDLQAQWAANDNTIDASWVNLRGAALGLELKAANPPVAVASVEVTPPSAEVEAGATVQFTATPRDAEGNALTGRAVTWGTSDPTIATVNQSGLVTAIAPGPVTISATSEGQIGSAAVTVVPVPVATVTIDPADATLGTGATLQLSATPRDAAGNPLTGRAVTWATSDEAVATVSETGLVTGVSVGTATMTAVSEGKSGTATVTVAAPVASIEVTPASADVQEGQTLQLSATARDANGDPLTGRVVSWTSSDEAVATVSSTGLVRAIVVGSATITAASEGQSGSSAITVTPSPMPVASVEVTPAAASVVEAATVQLVATLKDANGTVLSGRTVTWSSTNVAVATVDGNGLVTGVAAGSVTISATSEGKSGSSAVTVTRAAVASVEVTPNTATVEMGVAVQLTATPRDVEGRPLSGRVVTWTTSQTAVASVKATGLATALYEGSATITATSEGKSGTAALTVTQPPPGAPAILVGAGDIGDCSRDAREQTAKLLDEIAGTVFTAGDNAYPDGTATDYANCYDASWGRHKLRTRPSAGNHEYHIAGATGYFNYFGANAGPAGRGYYSYTLGEWHIVVLNSNVSMSSTSAQVAWLKADLEANPAMCTLAYWHHPRFSSGDDHGSNTAPQALFQALYDAHAEVIVNAHDHNYERFAPQTATGVADPERGIRQFVVGTGGRTFDGFLTPEANSEVRSTGAWGVLKLTLRSGGYDWKFVPVAGQTFTDEGSGSCHGPGEPPPNQAPVARPGGPYRSEGVTAFDGRASTDPENNTPLTYAWDFGDGNTGTGATPSHSYAADGVYTVTLVVTDTRDAASAPVTTAATIANIAPTVNVGADVFVRPGERVDLSAAFSDPGENDGPWTYVIDWGDGATESGTALTQAPIAAGHVYAAVGTFVVQMTVTDKDGGVGSDALTATVTESVPSPITHRLLTSGNHTTNQNVYTTASISPAPNALITVAVLGHNSTSAAPSPTLSGGGMSTWTEVATITFDAIATPLKRMTIFRAMSASPGSGPITIQFSKAQSNAEWIVSQWEGVDVSGVNGAGAIVQTGSARADAVSGLTLTLAPFGHENNVAYGVFGVRSSVPAVTPGAGFTEIAEHGSGESPPSDLQAQWAKNVNTILATWATAPGAALGIEIKAGTVRP